MTVRLAQVGLGGWGLLWSDVVQRSSEVELAACVDFSSAALELAQQKLGIAPEQCFASLDDAFAAMDIDAVLVTASLAGHVPAALTALEAGKHVLIEKPFAPSLAEAQRVIDVAAAQKRVLMVSQNYRFFPAARTAAALVREGTLGPVGAVEIDFRRYANTAAVEGHRHYALKQPLLLDMSIHHFDLMRMILGQPATQITCYAWNPPWSHFAEPAAATITVLFGENIVVSYRGSWVSPAPQTAWAGEWRIQCAEGEILWTGRNGRGATGDKLTVRPLGKAARRVELPELPHVDTAGSLAAFAAAIREEQEPETSGRDNLGSLALTYAAIESATSGLTVLVPQV